jgi:diguanylate cyclase (GGDEF)-like protein
VNGAPFQLACALALADSIYRLAKAGRGWWNLLLMAVLACIASIFLVRIPLYPLVFGPDANFATISASALEKGLMTTSALLTPPAVFLLLGRIVGDVIATYRSRAERDGLTGLYNRRALDEMAAIPDPAGGAVIFCDIDHFKRVNDTYGHAVGDRVIKAVAQTLKDHCAGNMVARIGGEEFVVLFPGLEPEAAGQILDDARDMLGARHFKLRETDQPLGRVTFSGGVARGRHADGTPALQRADALLYAAKNGGRNQVFCEAA